MYFADVKDHKIEGQHVGTCGLPKEYYEAKTLQPVVVQRSYCTRNNHIPFLQYLPPLPNAIEHKAVAEAGIKPVKSKQKLDSLQSTTIFTNATGLFQILKYF